MYHGDEENDETEKVWADFPNQKGLVELIHVSCSPSRPSLPFQVAPVAAIPLR